VDHTIVVMSLKIVTTSYGRAASVALRDELARLKGNEPLAPVTVIVPTNSVGVSARRLLASGALGAISGDRAGLVGVNFLTVFRLAELLAAGRLAAAGRRPVSTPVVAGAIRQVLAADPGLFESVSEHPATEEALVDAHRELSDLDDGALDVLASQSLRAGEVVRVHRAARKLLAASWYDEHDLMRAAVSVIAERTGLADIGPVVCHLPQRWSTPAARVVSALHELMDLVVIAGLTGVAAADAAVVASVERIGGKIDDNERSVPVAVGTEILDTSDADDEVRAIVRGVVDAMRAGTPLERMAILYGNDEPYARLLHEHLTLAGIVHNGASVRTLADSVLGAALLRLLALPDESFRRDHVFALLTSAPVLDEGRGRVPAVAWERLSRRAGIVGNPDEWQVRLERYAGELGESEWDERERTRAKALGEFVAALVADVEAGRGLQSWSALTRWAHQLIRRWLGAEHRRASWSAFEQEAARRVERALDRLGGLDTVDAGPTVAVFRRTLELELRSARDRIGRIGDGVLVGSASLSLGVDLERLWVCGLAEGVFPAVPHDDPLLGDGERVALDGELRLRRERVDENQRALLAALAATTGARVCTFPRGDLRRSTEHVPSRFLRPTLELASTRRTTIASFVQGLAREEFAPTRHELDVKAALAGQPWVAQQPALARGLALSRARRSDAFTRFDGNLAALADDLLPRSPASEGIVVSATRLEQWASCPHGYFMRYVLHLRQVDRPEAIEQLSPLDRGSLIHTVLDRFLREHVGRRALPWSEADHARMRAIATEEADLLEARGLSGRPLLWQRDRRMILAQLDDFLDADSDYRVERGVQTLATELQFVDVAVPLTDGRIVKFRGAADRVDVLDDGGLVVIDYKTGSNRDYTSINADDPVLGGARLQLPIYARAARAAFGDDATPVEAEYWFVGKGDNKTYGYEVDAAVDAALGEALALIVEGIEGGCFVAVPPPPGPHFFVQCDYCDPDARGTADRWREWERKFSAPELAGFRRLFGDEASEEPDE
jgi:RecB family exonuclease